MHGRFKKKKNMLGVGGRQSQSGGYQRVVTDYHLSLPMQEMVAGIIEEKLARIEEVEDPSSGPNTNLHTIQAAADQNLHIAQD
jgi:hypothetical protein